MNLFLKGEIMSMAQLKYKRVLLKISGEALAGDKHFGFDFDVVSKVCDVIKKCTDMGVQMGVVIGGGNFWRGVKNGEGYIERTRADHMGMLATAMNCMAVADVLQQKGVDVRVQTALEIKEVAEPYIRARAIRHLEKGRVVLFGCGIGSPSTLRSWTPRPRRFRWTTTFPCLSLPSRIPRTSSVRSRARRSAPLLAKTERSRICGFTIKIFEEVSP